MFLDVSGNVLGVDLNEQERRLLAKRLHDVRMRRFKGNKKAAYTAAGVNSATWERAESGQTVREHTRVQIVSALWPETGGDWTQIPADDPIEELRRAILAAPMPEDARRDMLANLDALPPQPPVPQGEVGSDGRSAAM